MLVARPADSPLTKREERIAAAVAAATMPAGKFLDAGGEATVAKLRRWLVGTSTTQVKAIRAFLWAAEGLSLARTGRPFSALPRARAEKLLVAWQASPSPLWRAFVRGLVT